MKRSLIAIFVMILCFGFYAWGFYNGSSGKATAQASMIAKAAVMESKLTDWVFSHSAKISKETANQIVKECLKTEKPLLTIALISIESEFVPSAVSNVGAVGLSQIMYGVHSKELIKAGIVKDRRDLFNIDVSVRAGSLLLNRFIRESNGDLPRALTKYLGGFNNWYVNKILADLGSLYILAGGQ
jgi:soluble lytic murein transglycosylase-like protein